jgi:quinol monooxygenase YgiN
MGSSGTVHVVARITAKPGKEENLFDILRQIVAPTRREAGCIRYELFRNDADPTDFTFVEEWESDAAIDSHMVTPHIQAAFATVEGLLAAAPDIRRYRKA